MTKYTVRIPIMCFVEVPVELDSDNRDDIIEKAMRGFKIRRFSDQSVDVETSDGRPLELSCEGLWDDEELITIQEEK